ncbi:hypothetical protein [Candidatus Symbiopectobacterium sp. NZEC135]|nr:hypothetical protein [Candidatus Symbiopectobacterium sp. NZEC135]MCW2478063.1 hypothetical protein [Candidatus Symbiopectobacterium sp. NZEC135]
MAKQIMLMELKNENFDELIGDSHKYIYPRLQREKANDFQKLTIEQAEKA